MLDLLSQVSGFSDMVDFNQINIHTLGLVRVESKSNWTSGVEVVPNLALSLLIRIFPECYNLASY